MQSAKKTWVIKYQRQPKENLWSALLNARQITDPGIFFSSASFSDLHDPFLFPDMHKAVERLKKALHAKERVVVYGDYDVDGISGAALLVHTLRMLGAEVSYRIPHRRQEGYGLHQRYVDELVAQNVSVLITVDTGIACAKEIASAQEQGLDVIITDHHTIPKALPMAYAILHPLVSTTYPFSYLSGSGVAFKLASALLMATQNQDWIPLLTDLASLGTVADCMPLTGENRTLVKLGLEQMKRTKWQGLEAILSVAGAWGESEFSTHTIGFQIGPRLNASGRMDNPLWALQALLAEGPTAIKKVQRLEELNQERQKLMEQIMEDVEAGLNLQDPLIIAEGPWSSGVVGLVASRLQEKYGKPVFILEDRGDHLVGSARSLPGYHCVDALRRVQNTLEQYGGHEQAAGFHLTKEHYPSFKEGLLAHASTHFQTTPMKRELLIDLRLQGVDLTLDTVTKLQSFAPFGVGNPPPLFLMEDVEILKIQAVGAQKSHLKFSSLFQGERVDGIAFRWAEQEARLRSARRLAVELNINEWRDQRSVQMKLVDAK